jgi:bla regulator protein blaR1
MSRFSKQENMLKIPRAAMVLGIGIMAVAVPVSSQASQEARRTFEVVSIKSNTSGPGPTMLGPQPGGRFVATNASARMLLRLAYRPMQDYQILGGPGWIGSDRFDVEAKANGTLTIDELAGAVQSMLQDRFQLQAHHESRELPIYVLTVGKDGAKLKSVDPPPPRDPNAPAPAPPPPPPPPGGPGSPGNTSFAPPPGAMMMGPGMVSASAVSMTQVVTLLSQLLGRPVIDKTNLKGFFDLKLQFAPDSAPGGPLGPGPGPPIAPAAGASDPSGPSIFTAIQDLGLKLDSTKGPVDVLVIDSVQKPTEN